MNRIPLLARLALASIIYVAGAGATAQQPRLDRTTVAPVNVVNLGHLDYLYTDVEIKGKKIGVVRIYSQYPDYRYAIEPDEGFSCVDDVSRALVLLSREWRHRHDPELLRKIRNLTEFVLHLQNGNGYFNNFLWGDLSINLVARTSVAELNWWSFRALWGLEEALSILKSDPEFDGRIREATKRVVANIVRDLPTSQRRTTVEAGIVLPTWLPQQSGADQAAEAIVALLPYYRRTGDPAVRRLLESLAEGILVMQKGNAETWPHGMFLSWRNTWHAWGNVQAYALLEAGEMLARPDWIAAALIEVDNFYPYLLETGFAEFIELRGEGVRFVESTRRSYPQIAYGMRPMIFAAEAAYGLTKNPKYRQLALDLAAWLHGRNDANGPLYDPRTGLTFDGIVARGSFNRNSGAESTIEALLTLQALRDGVP